MGSSRNGSQSALTYANVKRGRKMDILRLRIFLWTNINAPIFQRCAHISFYCTTLFVSAIFAVAWCPSVCPSVTLVYCIRTAKDIVKLSFFPSLILSFHRRTTIFSMVTHGEGRVFRSATPLRFHKCVARICVTANWWWWWWWWWWRWYDDDWTAYRTERSWCVADRWTTTAVRTLWRCRLTVRSTTCSSDVEAAANTLWAPRGQTNMYVRHFPLPMYTFFQHTPWPRHHLRQGGCVFIGVRFFVCLLAGLRK